MKKKDSIYTKRKNYNLKFFDYSLFLSIILVILFSLIIIFSVTSITNIGYFKKQLLWFIIGFIGMIITIFIDIEKMREYIPYMIIVVISLLFITLFMPPIHNVHRWIPLKFFNFQPSELAKILTILYISDYCDRNFSKINNLKFFIKPAIIIGIILALIALEPDLGTPVLIFGVIILTLFVAGIKIKYLLMPIISSIPILIYELYKHRYRLERLKTFLFPFEKINKETYQLAQSLIAIGSGGWFGVGPGASTMKLKFLPESHTDFIFPIIAEEFGFIGTTAIILFFLYFFYRGFVISKMAKNYFLSLIAISSTMMIVFQALFNIAMTVGVIPTKGLPLPFFSYGGTSIIVTMLFCGLILNVSINRKSI